MRALIWGAGAIGGTLGAYLARAGHDITLVDVVEEHVRETQSRFAMSLLNDWHLERDGFWQVVPKEMLDRLEHPVLTEPEGETAALA